MSDFGTVGWDLKFRSIRDEGLHAVTFFDWDVEAVDGKGAVGRDAEGFFVGQVGKGVGALGVDDEPDVAGFSAHCNSSSRLSVTMRRE